MQTMRRYYTVLLILVLCMSSAKAAQVSEYAGLVYPPLPNGLIEKGGGLMRGSIGPNALWYENIEGKGKSMVWLTKEIGRTVKEGKDLAVWRVIDVLVLPALQKGEGVHYGNEVEECSFKGVADTSIIAVGRWTWRKKGGGGYLHHVRAAWRLHPQLEKFEAIPPQQVNCKLDADPD